MLVQKLVHGYVGLALAFLCGLGQASAVAQSTDTTSSSLALREPGLDTGSEDQPFSSSLFASPPGEPSDDSPNQLPDQRLGGAGGAFMPRNEPDRVDPRPFSSLGVGLYVGTEGLGLQLASPLTAKLNLRIGASGAKFNPNITDDGFDILGDIRLVNAFAGVDILPFFYKLHRFRITPGVTLYNGSRMRAHYVVPGGQTFDLGYGTFTSDPNDPIRGDFNLDFGRKVAPRLTVGFGNISPRRGQRWTIPFEFGIEYIGRQPRIGLDLMGSTCDQTGCSSVTNDPEAQHDLAQEQVTLNSNIPSALRFLPIVSIGVGYRFGH